MRDGGSGRGGLSRRLRGPLRGLGAGVGAALLRLSGRLTRVRYLHREREDEALSLYGNVIYAIWHGRMWLPVARLGKTGAAVLVSLSADGEVIARAARSLGFRPVRGSTSRGGREGLEALTGLLENGRSVALTPDGPRGPRHRAAVGAVALSARTGRPILPVGAAASPAWSFASWDRFQLPRPGARGVIVYGEPVRVPAGEELEPWRRRLEAALDGVEAEADREVER